MIGPARPVPRTASAQKILTLAPEVQNYGPTLGYLEFEGMFWAWQRLVWHLHNTLVSLSLSALRRCFGPAAWADVATEPEAQTRAYTISHMAYTPESHTAG